MSAGDRQHKEAKEKVGVTDGRWAPPAHPSNGASAGSTGVSSGLPIRPQPGPQSGPLVSKVDVAGSSSVPPVVPGGWAPSVDVSLLSPPMGVTLGPPDGAPVEPPPLPPSHPVLGATLRPPLTGHGQVPQSLLSPIARATLRGEGAGEQRRPATAPVPPPAVSSTPSGAPASVSASSDSSAPASSVPFSAFSPAGSGEGQRGRAVAPFAAPGPSASPIPGLGAIPGLDSLPGTVPSPETLSALAKLPFAQSGDRTDPASSDPGGQGLWFHPHIAPAEQPAEPQTSAGEPPSRGDSPRDPATMAFPLPIDRPVPVHRTDQARSETGTPGPAETQNRPRSPYRTTGPVPTESPYRLVTESHAPSADDSYGLGRGGSSSGDSVDASDTCDGDDWFELPPYARPASGASWTAPPTLPARSTFEAPEVTRRPAPSFEAPVTFSPPRAAEPPVFGPPPSISPQSSMAPPSFAPPIPPAPIPPAPEDRGAGGRPRAGHRSASSPELSPHTGAIPVIRPPVHVRRPDDEEAAAAETLSLRVTPPDAKALFTTHTPATAPEGGAPGSAPPPIGLVPAKANIVPPAPAVAPPRPVVPKTAATSEAPDDESDPGKTRRVVVRGDLGSAGWVPAEGTKLPVVTPPTAPEEGTAPYPSGRRPEPDPAMVNWLGELREGGGRDGNPAPSAQGSGPSTPSASSPGASPSAAPAPPEGGGELGPETVQAAATIVPSRGRVGRKQRKAADKEAKRSDGRGDRRAEKHADERAADLAATEQSTTPDGAGERSGRKKRFGRSTHGGHVESEAPFVLPASAAADQERYEEDLDGSERGRLLSLIVFWAPALILLMLAGVVIWLVR